MTSELIERFEQVTGTKAHRFMRRGLCFAHRDFDTLLSAYTEGRPIYLYTGRGPSSAALHLGHMVPFYFSAYLQRALKCHIVIQITDDEKLLRDGALEFEDIDGFALSNIRDILCCGFDLSKTFIFLNSSYIGVPYRFSCEFERLLTLSQLRGAFGFTDECNTGYVSFPPKQMEPAFYKFFPKLFTKEYCLKWKAEHCPQDQVSEEKFDKDVGEGQKQNGKTKQQEEKEKQRKERMKNEIPQNLQPLCLIPCGYEQDPYWRLARDIGSRLGLPKPATLYNAFIPALKGTDAKMSASIVTTAIYMTDSAAEIKTKINKYAFSGGRDTKEE